MVAEIISMLRVLRVGVKFLACIIIALGFASVFLALHFEQKLEDIKKLLKK